MKQQDNATGTRSVDLNGDSPELIAFALLRTIAQIEQQEAGKDLSRFNREWLLDAYAECLEAVQGRRTGRAGASKAAVKGR